MKNEFKVFINPGHDRQFDPGAIGINGTTEAEVVFAVGDLLKDKLEEDGIDVVGFIQSDNLNYVVAKANQSGADLFVSIHCNCFNGKASGTETFFCDMSVLGEKYSKIVQKKLISQIGTVDRGVKNDTQSAVGYLFVLRCTSMPAILVELAFIDNVNDHEILVNKQEELAKAIADGISEIWRNS